MKRIALFGATSAIAQGFAREAAARGDRLFLVGRNAERLGQVAADLVVRGATVAGSAAADLGVIERHAALLDEAEAALGGLDVVLVAHGVLSDEARARADVGVLVADFTTNFLSAASLLTHVANRFEARRAGVIAVIGSVSGDRGRQSNYVYGSAKAALATFLQGLRNRLAPAGVAVITVKPGFVDTPMTAHLAKNPLYASPAAVGRGIYRAVERRADVVYLPWFWRPIMALIRLVPERIFKRLKL